MFSLENQVSKYLSSIKQIWQPRHRHKDVINYRLDINDNIKLSSTGYIHSGSDIIIRLGTA